MFGNPPPANPYRHPDSASASALAPAAPQLRRDHDRRVDPRDCELKARRSLQEVDPPAHRARPRIQLRHTASHHATGPPPFGVDLAARRAAPRARDVLQRVRAAGEAPPPPVPLPPPPHLPPPPPPPPPPQPP